MFKLILLVAVIATVKTDFIEDKLLNKSWKVIAASSSVGEQGKIPENCFFGKNITISRVVDCTCGPVKGHVINIEFTKGEVIKELLVPVESREDIVAIREITCDRPTGVFGNETRIYVKELDTDYVLTISHEINKLHNLILGRSTPSQAKFEELIKAADVIIDEPKGNWFVICTPPN